MTKSKDVILNEYYKTCPSVHIVSGQKLRLTVVKSAVYDSKTIVYSLDNDC